MANSTVAGQPEAPCAATVAIPATINLVQKHFKDWSGRCVRLRGLVYDDHLLADRMAMLTLIDSYRAPSESSISIYPEVSASGVVSVRVPDPAMVEIVGKLGRCADRRTASGGQERKQPDAISDYCPVALGNYIDPISITVTSEAPITRLTEKEVPPDQRRLIEAPLDLPHRAAQIAAVQAFVAAIKAGDEATFEKLKRPPDLPPIGTPIPLEVFRGSVEAFADIRLDSSNPQRAFVDRTDIGNEKRKMLGPPLIVCLCKTADCAGKWPVASDDADNMPERPYVCAVAHMLIREGESDGPIAVDCGIGEGGLAEPDWSKYQPAH